MHIFLCSLHAFSNVQKLEKSVIAQEGIVLELDLLIFGQSRKFPMNFSKSELPPLLPPVNSIFEKDEMRGRKKEKLR